MSLGGSNALSLPPACVHLPCKVHSLGNTLRVTTTRTILQAEPHPALNVLTFAACMFLTVKVDRQFMKCRNGIEGLNEQLLTRGFAMNEEGGILKVPSLQQDPILKPHVQPFCSLLHCAPLLFSCCMHAEKHCGRKFGIRSNCAITCLFLLQVW